MAHVTNFWVGHPKAPLYPQVDVMYGDCILLLEIFRPSNSCSRATVYNQLTRCCGTSGRC